MSPREFLLRAFPPASVAAAAGAGLCLVVDIQGARPAVLIGALSCAALGAAIGALIPRERLLHWRWWIGPAAAGGAAAAAAAGGGLPSPGPELLAGLAGLSWIVACGGSASPAGVVLAAAALLAGVTWPLAGFGAGLAGATWLARRAGASKGAAITAHSASLVGAGEAAAVLTGGALLVTASWAAGRSSLDPTPFGLAVAAAAALVAGGLAAAFAPRKPGALWPALGLAALITPALLGSLPDLAARQLFPLAGQTDPRLVLAALGAALVLPGALVTGLAWRRAATSLAGAAPALIALATGTWLGVDAGPATWSWALWLALLGGVVALLRSGRVLRRLLGLGLAAAAVAARVAPLPWPEVELLSGLTYQLRDTRAPDRGSALSDRQTPLSGGWGPGGAVLIQRDERQGLVLRLDGLPVEPSSRASDSERMAGHLAALLSGGGTSALVMGDDMGLVSEGLLIQGFERVDVAVPDVEALRALVAADPHLEAIELDPAIRHVRGSGEAALRWSPPMDAVVEIARTPWPDAHQGLPSARQLGRRARQLAPGGVYVLVVPSIWMETEQLRGLLGEFTDAFPAAWAFLPPSGADQLLLAGWSAPPQVSWVKLLSTLQRGATALDALDIRSALDLADRALVDREGMLALAVDTPARTLWLGGMLHRLPKMNLPLFHEQVADPTELFSAPSALAEPLRERSESNREFLELLSAASAGKLDDVFEKGRALSQRPGGSRSVAPVIESSLERARAYISRAQRAGPASPGWARAIQELQGALMVAPRAPEALTLLGECYLAQSNLARAKDNFERALDEDDAYLEAMHGMARVALERGDPSSAETWFRRAAERHPDSWLAAHELGALLFDTKRYDEAALAFKRASKLDPSQIAPHLGLGEIYIRLDQPTQVVIQGDLAVRLKKTPETLSLRGRGYYKVDQLQAAERDFTEAILLNGAYWPARALLCLVNLEKGDYQAAASFAKDALEQVPEDPSVRECLRDAEEGMGGSPAPPSLP